MNSDNRGFKRSYNVMSAPNSSEQNARARHNCEASQRSAENMTNGSSLIINHDEEISSAALPSPRNFITQFDAVDDDNTHVYEKITAKIRDDMKKCNTFLNKSLSNGISKTAKAFSCISSKMALLKQDGRNYTNNIKAFVRDMSKAEQMLHNFNIILKQNNETILRQ